MRASSVLLQQQKITNSCCVAGKFAVSNDPFAVTHFFQCLAWPQLWLQQQLLLPLPLLRSA